MRKTMIIKIKDRKNDLTFKITEMPATQLESWTLKALLQLAESGVNVPDGADVSQAAGFMLNDVMGTLGKLNFEKAKPLLDEMLACCARVDAGVEQICTPEEVDGYIEDMRTLLKLRIEAVKFNFGFLSEENASATQKEQHITIAPLKRS